MQVPMKKNVFFCFIVQEDDDDVGTWAHQMFPRDVKLKEKRERNAAAKLKKFHLGMERGRILLNFEQCKTSFVCSKQQKLRQLCHNRRHKKKNQFATMQFFYAIKLHVVVDTFQNALCRDAFSNGTQKDRRKETRERERGKG